MGDFIADILLDVRPNGTIYHWLVQRVGSAAIIQWGQEYTFEDAYSAVSAYLENLGRPNKESLAGGWSFVFNWPVVLEHRKFIQIDSWGNCSF